MKASPTYFPSLQKECVTLHIVNSTALTEALYSGTVDLPFETRVFPLTL